VAVKTQHNASECVSFPSKFMTNVNDPFSIRLTPTSPLDKNSGEKKLKFYENKNNKKKLLEKVKTTSNINEMREKRKLNLHESNFKV
jgi:hypothetical protein